jgi:thiamine pyrophosphate-dependent acetolactate synthase large subunit-like protein
MDAEDWFIDELIEALSNDAESTVLTRHLAELFIADDHPRAAQKLAVIGLRTCPDDVRLLRVLVAVGVAVPDTVDELMAVWAESRPPAGW